MTKYIVSGKLIVSCWTEVDASTPEEAKRIAMKRPVAEHHIDGSYPDDENWHFENDGMPDRIEAEKK